MKRIAVDMDEVIADFQGKHIAVYNEQFNDQLTMEELQGTRLWKLRSHLSKEILDLVDDPNFFRDLDVMKGSQEVLKELNEEYEIFITTAAMEHPSSFTAKYEWLKEHFPFLCEMNFVFCGNKSIIHADYLIDDSVRHFKHFSGTGLLFTSPHNINEKGYTRVNNWNEVKEFFANNN